MTSHIDLDGRITTDMIHIGTWRDSGAEYRAAYVGGCVLTAPEHADLSDADLLTEAVREAERMDILATTYTETGTGAFPHRTLAGGDQEWAQPAATADGRRVLVIYTFTEEECEVDEIVDMPWDDDHRDRVIDFATGATLSGITRE